MLKSMKICNGCKKPREDSEFNANASRKSGSQTWCRECTTEYNRQWYEANKEKHCQYVREHDKRPRKIHACKMCKKSEPDVEFAIRKEGNRYYRRFLCRECEVEYRKKYPHKTRTLAPNREEKALRESVRRASKENRASYILRDSSKSDRRRILENDLDLAFIEMLIMRPCAYCGNVNGKITLDRIDNSLGHLKSNVVQACSNCNYFRGDMPFAAWKLLIPSLKKARKLGLLNEWHCGTGKKKRGMILGLVAQ